ncbi:hypothetical protein LTR53_013112 [Teratosphaeriaceae sp. CCFEE 6253]|nr:hypothetical protein LTR53_013112 [Teratosphaeriaceae sp. CCFEE 6253]
MAYSGAGELYMDDVGRVRERETAYPFRFLDLPGELRDHIYEIALVQTLPIEYAPLIPGRCREEEYWEYLHDNGQRWHGLRLQLQIKPSLHLLRSNRQICREATPIFYGQALRFTSEAGWIVLETFIDRIGPAKSALLKDITVCHPTLSTWPSDRYWAPHRTTLDLMDLGTFSRAVPKELSQYAHAQTQGAGERSRYETSRAPHRRILAAMSDLRKLSLVLHMSHDADLWQRPIATDAILDAIAAILPSADLEVLHLAELTEDDIANFTAGRWTISDGVIQAPAGMRATFATLVQRGIPVIEQRYDRHTHYPVQPSEPCVNKGICDYMRQYTACFPPTYPSFQVCLGTVELLDNTYM